MISDFLLAIAKFNSLLALSSLLIKSCKLRVKSRAVDPHSFFADPDPAVFLNADPDPEIFLNADSDPAAF